MRMDQEYPNASFAAACAWLFVPADRPERLAKALASGADAVIVDLEDAVAEVAKRRAREQLREALGAPGARVCVRINAADTPHFEQDLALLSLPRVAAAMLPKACSVQDLSRVRAAMPHDAALLPIVESARGLAAARELARAPGVLRLVFGSVDFQQDLGIEGDDEALLFARSELVLASRLAGIGAPVDGVTLSTSDLARIHADGVRARRLGFGAKLCIHPAQIAPVREAFAPDAAALEWAHGVMQAVEAAGGGAGAIRYRNEMVDRPVIERARSLLSRARA